MAAPVHEPSWLDAYKDLDKLEGLDLRDIIGFVMHPKEWFDKAGPGVKPTLSGEISDQPLDICGNHINAGLRFKETNMKVVLKFMIEFMRSNIQGTLDEAGGDWESFGCTIGTRGQEITPMSLLRDDTVTAATPAGLQAVFAHPREHLGLFAKVVAVYALGEAKNRGKRDNQVAGLQSRIRRVLTAPPYGLAASALSDLDSVSQGWTRNTQYRMLIAALDMFLIKFPQHRLAGLRICTEAARYKECVLLESLNHLKRVLGKPSVIDVLRYAPLPFSVVATFRRMIEKEGQMELTHLDSSYLPYLRELELSRYAGSPYTLKRNQEGHAWLHCVGALIGSKRSQGAHVSLNSAILGPMGIANYAAVIATRREYNAAIDDEGGVDVDDLAAVTEYLNANQKKLLEPEKEEIRRRLRCWEPQREQTIGYELQRLFL